MSNPPSAIGVGAVAITALAAGGGRGASGPDVAAAGAGGADGCSLNSRPLNIELAPPPPPRAGGAPGFAPVAGRLTPPLELDPTLTGGRADEPAAVSSGFLAGGVLLLLPPKKFLNICRTI